MSITATLQAPSLPNASISASAGKFQAVAYPRGNSGNEFSDSRGSEVRDEELGAFWMVE